MRSKCVLNKNNKNTNPEIKKNNNNNNFFGKAPTTIPAAPPFWVGVMGTTKARTTSPNPKPRTKLRRLRPSKSTGRKSSEISIL